MNSTPTLPRGKKPHPRKQCRLTNARLGVLEVLANFYIATAKQVSGLRLGHPPTEHDDRQTRQILLDLTNQGYVRHRDWKVRVYGLTAKGVAEATRREMSDACELTIEKSLELIPHELKRTATHAVIEALCETNAWPLRWQKTDLHRTIHPDDLISIAPSPDGNYRYIPFELENEKKTREALYAKAKTYFDYYDTDKCLTEWGYFRKFNPLFQFANEERMRNFLDFLTAQCRCVHYRGKIRHSCLPYGLQKPAIITNTFLFTHDTLVYNNPSGKILFTPADYATRAYSFADL